MRSTTKTLAIGLLTVMSLGLAALPGAETQLSAPDGKPADMTKPVQVFILMGQGQQV